MGQDQGLYERDRLPGSRINAGLIARTPRLAIRPLQRADVDKLAEWEPFTEPLLLSYNTAMRTAAERDGWFAARTGDPARREVAGEDAQGALAGRIGLRDMDGRGRARLGIVIRAGSMNQGYGTEALAAFLDWYFGPGGFSKMVLDVSAANPRAKRVYDKLGFRRVMDFYRPIEAATAAAVLQDSRYAEAWPHLHMDGGRMFILFHEMELTREDWQKVNFKYQMSNSKSQK